MDFLSESLGVGGVVGGQWIGSLTVFANTHPTLPSPHQTNKKAAVLDVQLPPSKGPHPPTQRGSLHNGIVNMVDLQGKGNNSSSSQNFLD